jgi:uncharacterized protein (TIGR03435 family)
MKQMDDWQLLRDYATRNSEEAFRALVDRYAGLVYHAALRQAGNPHTAEEVTQAVFIALAQKADRIPRGAILSGWLFLATRFAFSNLAREQIRRQRREQEAVMMETILRPDDTASVWEQIVPHLNDALDKLPRKDREAVLVRFFQDKSHRELARTLDVSEDAAKVRVSRALEKLRLILARQGYAVPSAVLLATISAHGAQAAPAGLTASVASVAVAKGTAGTTSTLTIAKGVLKIMAWTKMKSAIVIAAVALAGAGTTTLTIKVVSHYREESIWNNITGTHISAELKSAQPAVSIRPTRFTREVADFAEMWGKSIGVYQPFEWLLAKAYGISACRVLALTPLPPGDFDFITSVSQRPREALQKMIKQKFGITGRRETRETDVLLLKVKWQNAPGLKPTPSKAGSSMSSEFQGVGHLSCTDGPISSLIYGLQYYLQVPVVDRTGLAGRFDVDLTWDDEMKWDGTGHYYFSNPDGLKQVVLDQLGLELVPSREPIEMLVVEKAK